MKYRYIIILLILLSCREEKIDSESILFQHYFTGSLSSGIDNLTSIVNINQNKINLISAPMEHEEFKISIRVQLEGSNPPDLFSYWAGARTKFLIERGKVSPITDLFKKDIDRSLFDKSVLRACSYNDEIYMLPITRHYVGFFYNKKIFSNNGIEEPRTWNQLIEAATKIKSNNITPFALGAKNRWPAQFWFDYILLRSAGFEYREELMNSNASYSDTEVIRTVKLWKDLIDSDFFGPNMIEDDWDKKILEVATGDSAMTLMGTWAIPLLESRGLKPDIDYGFFPFPIINPDHGLDSLGPIDGVLLSAKSKSNKSSKIILNQLALAKTQEAFNSNSGAIAPHLLVDDSVYNPIQLQIKELIKKNKNWAFNYDLATTPIISENGLNFFVDFLQSPSDYIELLIKLEEHHIRHRN